MRELPESPSELSQETVMRERLLHDSGAALGRATTAHLLYQQQQPVTLVIVVDINSATKWDFAHLERLD
jgi:hypothetical protein